MTRVILIVAAIFRFWMVPWTENNPIYIYDINTTRTEKVFFTRNDFASNEVNLLKSQMNGKAFAVKEIMNFNSCWLNNVQISMLLIAYSIAIN